MGTLITALVLLVIVIWVLASCIKIVPQAQAYVVERLGAYQGTWSVGLHFKTPFIDKIAKKVVLKEQVVDFAPQPVITKDNVTMRLYFIRSQIRSCLHTVSKIRSWQSKT